MESEIIMENKTVKNENKKSSRFNSSKSILSICVTSILLAVAIVIDLMMKPLLAMPQGGHISIALIPIVLMGLVCGPLYGFIGATCFGILNFFIDGGASAAFNPWSFVLDYVLAFGMMGVVGFFHKFLYSKKPYWVYFVSLIIASLVRYLFSGLSGAWVFAEYAPENTNPWFYSFVLYNAGYIFASLGVSLVLITPLMFPLQKLMGSYSFRTLNPNWNIQ